MKTPRQTAMHCPCGRAKIVALGLCATCYTLRRQDAAYYGGNREVVLARDGHRCRVPGCTTLKRGKRSVAVHHRVPGNNDPKLMLTLCLACHAKVSRTLFVQDHWPPLLLLLWREQHPDGQEQIALDSSQRQPVGKRVPLFSDFLDGLKQRFR